ncbi:MAG: hypothetical protein EZS28_021929, partial [Streblomastix strix]
MARFSLNYDLRIPIIDFSLPPINIIQECGGFEVVATLPNSQPSQQKQDRKQQIVNHIGNKALNQQQQNKQQTNQSIQHSVKGSEIIPTGHSQLSALNQQQNEYSENGQQQNVTKAPSISLSKTGIKQNEKDIEKQKYLQINENPGSTAALVAHWRNIYLSNQRQSLMNIDDALLRFRLSPFCLPAHMMRFTTVISHGMSKHYPMTPLISALRYERQGANLNKEPLQMILQFVKQHGAWTPRQQLMLFSEDYVNIRMKPTLFNTYYTHIQSGMDRRWIQYTLQLPLSYLSKTSAHDIKKRMDYKNTAIIGSESDQSSDDEQDKAPNQNKQNEIGGQQTPQFQQQININKLSNLEKQSSKYKQLYEGNAREPPIYKFGLPFPASLSRVQKHIVNPVMCHRATFGLQSQGSNQFQQFHIGRNFSPNDNQENLATIRSTQTTMQSTQTAMLSAQSEVSIQSPLQHSNGIPHRLNTEANTQCFLTQWNYTSASLSGHLFRHQQNLLSALICAFFAFTEAMCFQSSDRTGNPGDSIQPNQTSQVTYGEGISLGNQIDSLNIQNEGVVTQGQIIDELNKTLLKGGSKTNQNTKNMQIKQRIQGSTGIQVHQGTISQNMISELLQADDSKQPRIVLRGKNLMRIISKQIQTFQFYGGNKRIFSQIAIGWWNIQIPRLLEQSGKQHPRKLKFQLANDDKQDLQLIKDERQRQYTDMFDSLRPGQLHSPSENAFAKVYQQSLYSKQQQAKKNKFILITERQSQSDLRWTWSGSLSYLPIIPIWSISTNMFPTKISHQQSPQSETSSNATNQQGQTNEYKQSEQQQSVFSPHSVITSQADLLSVFQFLSLSEDLTSKLQVEILNVLNSSSGGHAPQSAIDFLCRIPFLLSFPSILCIETKDVYTGSRSGQSKGRGKSNAAQILSKQLSLELSELEQKAGINVDEGIDEENATGSYMQNRGPPNKNLQIFTVETNTQLMNCVPYYKITNGRGSQPFALTMYRVRSQLYGIEQVDSARRQAGSAVFPDKLNDEGNPVWLVDLIVWLSMAVSSPPPIEYGFGGGITPMGLVNCISAGLAHSPLEYVLSFFNRLVREVLSHFHDNPWQTSQQSSGITEINQQEEDYQYTSNTFKSESSQHRPTISSPSQAFSQTKTGFSDQIQDKLLIPIHLQTIRPIAFPSKLKQPYNDNNQYQNKEHSIQQFDIMQERGSRLSGVTEQQQQLIIAKIDQNITSLHCTYSSEDADQVFYLMAQSGNIKRPMSNLLFPASHRQLFDIIGQQFLLTSGVRFWPRTGPTQSGESGIDTDGASLSDVVSAFIGQGNDDQKQSILNSGLIEQAEDISTLKQHYLVLGSEAQFSTLNLWESVISIIDPAVFPAAPSPMSFSIQTPQCSKIGNIMQKAQSHSAAMMQSILDLDRVVRLLPGEMGDQNIVDISRKIVLDSISARRKQIQQNLSPHLTPRVAPINRTVPEFQGEIQSESSIIKPENTLPGSLNPQRYANQNSISFQIFDPYWPSALSFFMNNGSRS